METNKRQKYIRKIFDLTEDLSNNDFIEVIGEVLIEMDLEFLGNLVKERYEPLITSIDLVEDYSYTEGEDIDLDRLIHFEING